MPHKRAKRSVREQEQAKKGTDLAPTRGAGDALSNEPLPKGFARAINAVQVRAEFRKRKLENGDGGNEDGDGPKKRRKVDGDAKQKGKGKEETRIRPGETLAHFNKRIESDMRPLVRSAMQSSLATVRSARKSESSTAASPAAKSTAPRQTSSNSKSKAAADASIEESRDKPPKDKHASRPKEFARTSTAAPRRLNDIAQAPPDLSASLKRAKSNLKYNPNAKKASAVLSPAQQLQMVAAREEAVKRYREMKAARRAGAGGGAGGADEE
ncbi:hypothetical protein MSAN_01311800 [Mycena sanguinolenta]|uniref:Uncharacterized protein n=1 Tax=Mycena sanguinolenta TaxID=230812 RepID=A0A8H6YF62_9AGAR|nr:hypothetical protein MSAN_01311800 [Mycena sanguinolenta]